MTDYRDPIPDDSQPEPDDYVSVIAEWLARDGVWTLKGRKVA